MCKSFCVCVCFMFTPCTMHRYNWKANKQNVSPAIFLIKEHVCSRDERERGRVRLRHEVKKKPTKNYYSQNATKSLNQILVASLPPRNECELVNWSSFVRHHFKCNKTLMTLKLASASASSTFTCFCFSDVLLLCYLLWQTECVCIHLHYVFE